MNNILISINPEYVKSIIDGTKRFEYRTRVAKQYDGKLIIYCTFPTMRVLAEAEIEGIIALPPEELWEKTKDYSGITKKVFDQYFAGRKTAYAYQLGRVTEYAESKSLSDFGCKSAPQSFVYVR